jgi:hypothetical protein
MYPPEPKRLLRKTVKTLSADGTTDTLLFDIVPPDQQWFIDWVSCMNDDSTITSWYPFIRTPSGDYPIHQPANTTQDLRHGLQVQTWLTGGERLGVTLLGATATNDLYAWLIGHYRTVGE